MENEKCFCHLKIKGERYIVKDATARQEIENLKQGAIKEDKVNELITNAINPVNQEIAQVKNKISMSAEPNTIPERDDENRINIGYPVEGNHGANKFYVDEQLNALKNEIISALEGDY